MSKYEYNQLIEKFDFICYKNKKSHPYKKDVIL